MKRVFDFTMAAALSLLVLAPLFAIISILVKLDFAGPVFFKQERMGKGFRPFLI